MGGARRFAVEQSRVAAYAELAKARLNILLFNRNDDA